MNYTVYLGLLLVWLTSFHSSFVIVVVFCCHTSAQMRSIILYYCRTPKVHFCTVFVVSTGEPRASIVAIPSVLNAFLKCF